MDKLFSFQGRFDRATYWKYTAGLGVASLVLWLVFQLILSSVPLTEYDWYSNEYQVNPAGIVVAVIFSILFLVLGIANLAVSVRRWHDLGKSGMWVLVGIVPIVGTLYAFAMQGFVEGTRGPNAYGPPTSDSPDQANTHVTGESSVTSVAMSDRARNSWIASSVALVTGSLGIIFAAYDPWYSTSYHGSTLFIMFLFFLVAVAASVFWGEKAISQFGRYPVALFSDVAIGTAAIFAFVEVLDWYWFAFISPVDVMLFLCALTIVPSLKARSELHTDDRPRRGSLWELTIFPVLAGFFIAQAFQPTFGRSLPWFTIVILWMASASILAVIRAQESTPTATTESMTSGTVEDPNVANRPAAPAPASAQRSSPH